MIRYDLLACQNRYEVSRGVPRYVKNLALSLECYFPGFVNEYIIHPDLPTPAGLEGLISSGKVVRADRVEDHAGPGVFIGGSFFEDYAATKIYPLWARRKLWRSMFVVHDLIPAIYPHWYLQGVTERIEYHTKLDNLRFIDQLLAVSEATAEDLRKFGMSENRITVVGAGVNDFFRKPTSSSSRVADELAKTGSIKGLTNRYVLLPSGVDNRKNVEPALEAFADLPDELRTQYKLVLVCELPPDYYQFIRDLALEFGIADQFIAAGFVDDPTLVKLYQGASLVIFPSLYEGFGLPVLEAMSCGAPVICSDSSSLRELQTNPRARFDASSLSAMTDALEQGLSDDRFRHELRNQPLPDFSWRRAAERTVEIGLQLQDVVRRRPSSIAAGKPTLALVTPWPPQASGIATYAHRLVEELRRYFDVTVFVDTWQEDLAVLDGVTLAKTSSLVIRAESGLSFDHTLYFVGNSEYHLEAFEVLKLVPGDVLLHDVRLTGLYSELYSRFRHRLRGGSVGATLRALYPGRYSSQVENMEVVHVGDAERYGIYLTAEVVGHAKRVLVHSDFAAKLVELDVGRSADLVFRMPIARSEGRVARPLGADPIVSSFGYVGPEKCPELVITAFGMLLSAAPDARLRFVGTVPDGYERKLRQDLSPELSDRIEFTGFTSEAEYLRSLQETTIAVQLRNATNGESSAAVADLIGAGVPTIANDFGPMCESTGSALHRLAMSPSAEELSAAMSELWRSPSLRAQMEESCAAVAEGNSFDSAARRLAEFLLSGTGAAD